MASLMTNLDRRSGIQWIDIYNTVRDVFDDLSSYKGFNLTTDFWYDGVEIKGGRIINTFDQYGHFVEANFYIKSGCLLMSIEQAPTSLLLRLLEYMSGQYVEILQ